MKKTILLTVLFLSAIINFSCSGDDDSSSQNNLEQKLIGSWRKSYTGVEKKLTFRTNHIVDFHIIHPGGWLYVGEWNLDGDILTLTFNDFNDSGSTQIYMQKISFPNENKMLFEQVPDSEYGIVEGDFNRINN